MTDYITKLKQVFGYEDFRPYQLDIIKSILSGRDTLAIMFTSAGKSLCYQFPAVFTEKVVLCVSPLIALIDDQIFKMNSMGISCVALNSTVWKKNQLIEDILLNKYRIVYVTPDFIVKNDSFFFRFICQ